MLEQTLKIAQELKTVAVGGVSVASVEIVPNVINTVIIPNTASEANLIQIIVQILIGVATLIKLLKKPKKNTDNE